MQLKWQFSKTHHASLYRWNLIKVSHSSFTLLSTKNLKSFYQKDLIAYPRWQIFINLHGIDGFHYFLFAVLYNNISNSRVQWVFTDAKRANRRSVREEQTTLFIRSDSRRCWTPISPIRQCLCVEVEVSKALGLEMSVTVFPSIIFAMQRSESDDIGLLISFNLTILWAKVDEQTVNNGGILPDAMFKRKRDSEFHSSKCLDL